MWIHGFPTVRSLPFFILFSYLRVCCVWVLVCVWDTAHVCNSEDNLQMSVLTFYHMSTRDWTHINSLCRKWHFDLQGQLAGPFINYIYVTYTICIHIVRFRTRTQGTEAHILRIKADLAPPGSLSIPQSRPGLPCAHPWTSQPRGWSAFPQRLLL